MHNCLSVARVFAEVACPGEHSWISGCKKDGTFALFNHRRDAEDVREEYWTQIRNKPEKKTIASFKCVGNTQSSVALAIGAHNKSLDASGGSVFLNLIRPAILRNEEAQT